MSEPKRNNRGCRAAVMAAARGAMVLGMFAVLALLALPGALLADAPLRTSPPPERPGTLELEQDPLAPAPLETGRDLMERLVLSGYAGWALADLDTGEVLDSHQPDRSFAPASVAKLPTALFALDALGVDHRFETRLVAIGPVEGGLLRGDLVLRGGHDPELDTDTLAPLAKALSDAGITGVRGRFIVDTNGGVRVPQIDPNQPVDVAYNPGVSALNLNFNRVFLRWGPQVRSQGTDARGVALSAKAERLEMPVETVRARVRSRRGYPFAHQLADTGEVWDLSNRALTGSGARWLPVKQPELYAGDVLRALARSRGIRLPRPEFGRPAGSAVPWLLARRESRLLPTILSDMLKFSTNLTAEVVGTAAAIESGARPETLAQSAAVMNAWAGKLSGALPGDPRLRFVNHSGLTTLSRVSPARMVQFLVAATRIPHGPILGTSDLPGPGALLLRPYSVAIDDDPLDLSRVEIRAKTGTMDKIRGLAGYIRAANGRRMAFAIFANDLGNRGQARRGIDRGWMNRARNFERSLIRIWLERHGEPEPAQGSIPEPERVR